MWISFLDLLQCPNVTSTAIYILHNTIHQDTFIESECKSGPMKQDVLHRTLLRLWLRKWLQDKPTDMYIDFWREVLNSINVIWGNNKVIPWGKQVTLRIILKNKPRWNEGYISVAAAYYSIWSTWKYSYRVKNSFTTIRSTRHSQWKLWDNTDIILGGDGPYIPQRELLIWIGTTLPQLTQVDP